MKAASRSDRDRAGVRNDVRHVLVTQARQMGRRKGEKLKHVSVMNAGLFRHVIPFKIQKKCPHHLLSFWDDLPREIFLLT